MKTIYLSSTYEDLKVHRRVVFDALRKAGYDVIAMEDYVATDNRPVAQCLADVAKSDIYVGIFAFRYGYIAPAEHGNPDGLSITELEFRYADKEVKIPCLTFMVDEKKPWSNEFNDAWTDKEEKGEHIKRLRDYLQKEKMASFFSSPHELATLVLAAVNNVRQESEPRANIDAFPDPEITWDIEKKGSPYPGLMHFTRKYAPVFFGRDGEIREILDRIHASESCFIIVSGDSGTGKSSLIDAGVLPQLEEMGLPGDMSCRCLRMVPSQGNHPFDALIRVLHPYAERAGFNLYDISEELVDQPGNFAGLMKTIFSKGIDRDVLVLFVDQMEELFTASAGDQSRELTNAFLSALHQGVYESPLWVIATIRNDFLHYCYRYPDMLRVLNGPGHYALGRVEPYMMDDMIKKPAQSAGLSISDNLVRWLIKDTGSQPGNLPLLAFVLRRLYDEKQGNILSETVYKDFGGVEGAIADHIKAVEIRLTDKFGNQAPNLLPQLFRSLLQVDAEGLPNRRRAQLSCFSDMLRPIVDVLIKERLFSTEGEGEKSTVSIAHEKLFDVWPGLALWISDNRDDMRVVFQAKLEAREWQKHGYDKTYLWHADRLKRLQEIITQGGDGEIDTLVKQYAWPHEKLIERLVNDSYSHSERQAIGDYLLKLGDTRSGVGLTSEGIPDIDWVEIPCGQVTLKDRAGSYQVEPFRIARYPVTIIQFQAFVDAEEGYGNKKWWADLERTNSPKPPYWGVANHPRENVNWYEAVAFCRWLSARLGYEVRLPTEWEWQQAATGGDSRTCIPGVLIGIRHAVTARKAV